MLGVVFRRVLQAALTLLLATLVFQGSLALLPGDPVRALFGLSRPDPEVLEALRAEYGLDQPFVVQYARYVGGLLHGDLGRSFPGAARNNVVSGPPVSDIVRQTAPVSLRILAGALALQVGAGVAAGALAADRAHRLRGWLLTIGAVLLVSIPVLVTGYVAQTVFGYELRLLPATSIADWRGYVLPIVTLAAASTGYLVLLSRAEVDEMLRQPFLRAARARAVPSRRLIGVHALRASLVPLVAFLAANMGQLFGGLVIVEGIFGVPGLGGTVFRAIQSRDRTLLVGILTLAVIVVVIVSAIADVLTRVIDPRLRRG